MSNINDFVIENGVLKKYTGAGGEVIIPDGVTCIGEEAFSCCQSLTTVTIPDSVTSIGDSAFSYCQSLTTVTIPDSVTSIGDSVFSYCKSLTTITIPDSVTCIGERAFSWCQSLTTITIPDGVTSIGDFAFYYCGSLTTITIPDSVTSIGDHAFCYCGSLTTITIPDGVTSIDAHAFEGCKSLANITIPDSVTSIGDNAFNGCKKLTSIVLPDSVTKIGCGTFDSCDSLVEVTVPKNVAEVGAFAFANCSKLERVVIEGIDMDIDFSSFVRCINLKEVVIPDNFIATTKKLSVALIDYIKEFTENDIAHIWLLQNDKWLLAAQKKKSDMNNISVLISDLIAGLEKITPKILKRIVAFVACATPEITREKVKCICDAVIAKDEKAGKKLSDDPVIANILASEVEQEEKEPVEQFVLSLIQQRPIHPEAFVFKQGIPYANKTDKLCSVQLMNFLVSEYLYLYDDYRKVVRGEMSDIIQLKVPTDAVIPENADKIAEALDKNALSDALEKMVNSFSKGYRLVMYAYARFATEESVKRLTRFAPSGSPSKVRYWKENLEEALLFSETAAAVDFLEKKGRLGHYVAMRGMSIEQFRDKHSIPVWDMNEQGVIKSVYGRVLYKLTPDFSLMPIDAATGKELRSISSKSDPESAAEYKELKKTTAAFYKKRVEYIRDIYISGQKITIKHWNESYFGNPVLLPITEKVIWSDAIGENFVVNGKMICKVDGSSYEPVEYVKIAHVLDMTAQEIEQWQKYLVDNIKILLIEQVWEPVAVNVNPEVFTNMVLSKEDRNEFKRTLGRKSIKVYSEYDYSEFNHRAGCYEVSETATMTVGSSMTIDYTVNKETAETTFTKINAYKGKITREVNSVLYELGRVCVKSAIRQNKYVLLSSLLETEYTVAQISEFIRLSQQCENTQATALLLEYQNKHFDDLDPITEFVLD